MRIELHNVSLRGEKEMLKDKYSFEDLIDIMKLLRSENGCPWDKEQTHDSLRKYLIEETYEVLETIDLNDKKKLCGELGRSYCFRLYFTAELQKKKDHLI